MGCCQHGVCYFIAGFFLLLGAGGLAFGVSSGVWGSSEESGTGYVQSIWLVCDANNTFSCEFRDLAALSETAEWMAEMGLMCAGVVFAAAALFTWICMCCCCTEKKSCMESFMLFLMLVSGGSAAAASVMFALYDDTFEDQRWASWDDFAADPLTKYGYFAHCGGAALMMLGMLFSILGCCCSCNDDDKEKV